MKSSSVGKKKSRFTLFLQNPHESAARMPVFTPHKQITANFKAERVSASKLALISKQKSRCTAVVWHIQKN
jgi:hypothetical protein